MNPVKAIVTDIEGTTSSIAFVKETLFPYAYENLEKYIHEHQETAHISKILEDIRQDLTASATIEDIIKTLRHWIDTDQKKTPLKTLQGYIWQYGYESGAYTAHMYADAVVYLRQWSKALPIYVYSSGSIKAQDLFFRYSEAGNIKTLFKGFFDTTTGPKKDAASYTKIAKAIDHQAGDILFLSDCKDEIQAAQQAGFQVAVIERDLDNQQQCTSNTFNTFAQVHQHYTF